MLATKHSCYAILSELHNKGENVSKEINEVRYSDKVPQRVVEELRLRKVPVVEFYLNLNKRAHKVIKELLTCEGKPVSNYIKIATSLITQGTIMMEHIFAEDTVCDQNDFIECLGLEQLAAGLHEYFHTGDYSLLVSSVNKNRLDVKQLLD